MQTYKDVIATFKEKNPKQDGTWKYDLELGFHRQGGRVGLKPGGLVEPGVTHYAKKGKVNQEALSKWLLTQDKTISRAALTEKVKSIWGMNIIDAQKQTSRILKDNPELFKNIKVLSGPEVKGTADFKKYLETTNKRSTTVPQLIEDFKKKTKKTITEGTEKTFRNIATEFSDKFNLAVKKNWPPNKIEQKAINAYKKLSQEQKFAFQVGGPSQKGVYAKWLTEQGLDSGNTGQTRFRKLLEREGLYKKAPIKTSAEIAKKAAERTSGIGISGATTYEQDLAKYKKNVLAKLGIKADRVPFDQAHRLSYKQMARLGEKYTSSNIGTDWVRTNTSAARKLEVALEPLYDKQYNIWKKAKKNPSKELSKSLDKINNQIAELVAEKSNGRIQGIQIDPYNLKVKSTPINYKYAADLGTTTKPLSQITKGSPEDIAIRLNYPEQIKREALESGLIKKVPKNFQKNINTTIKPSGTALHSFPANILEMAEMADPRKLPGDVAHIAKGVATKFPKTMGLLKGIFETKSIPGMIGWGIEPVLLMAGGLYGRYASERDFKAGLIRAGASEQEAGELAELYGQDLADLGNVGLESWAVDQPNTYKLREDIKKDYERQYQEAKSPHLNRDFMKQASGIRDAERRVQDYEKQLEEIRRQEIWKKAKGRGSKTNQLNYDNYLPDIDDDK